MCGQANIGVVVLQILLYVYHNTVSRTLNKSHLPSFAIWKLRHGKCVRPASLCRKVFLSMTEPSSIASLLQFSRFNIDLQRFFSIRAVE